MTANGNVFVTTVSGIYALQASRGKILWFNETDWEASSTPALSGGLLYYGSEQGDIFYALNPTTGAVVWTYQAGGEIFFAAAVAGGAAYFAAYDGNVYAIKTGGPNAGSLLWTSQLGDTIFSSIAVANNQVFVGGRGNGTMYALDASTGSQNWATSIASQGSQVDFRSPIVANGVVYATATDDSLHAFAASYWGKLASAVTGSTDFGTPVMSDGVLYVSANGGNTYAFALQAGVNVIRAPKFSNLRPDPRLHASR